MVDRPTAVAPRRRRRDTHGGVCPSVGTRRVDVHSASSARWGRREGAADGAGAHSTASADIPASGEPCVGSRWDPRAPRRGPPVRRGRPRPGWPPEGPGEPLPPAGVGRAPWGPRRAPPFLTRRLCRSGRVCGRERGGGGGVGRIREGLNGVARPAGPASAQGPADAHGHPWGGLCGCGRRPPPKATTRPLRGTSACQQQRQRRRRCRP